jgi:hypothetical protein
VTDRPIIFSAPMIYALLARRKSMTRRLARSGAPYSSPARQFVVGDRLWVRENFYLTDNGHEQYAVYAADAKNVREHMRDVEEMKFQSALANIWPDHARLRPSIHMPRWASRLTLIVDTVKVEFLQDISEEDALAEGVVELRPPDRDGMRHFGLEGETSGLPTARLAFFELWASINGIASYRANPVVVAPSFRVIEANIDALAEAGA